MLQAMTGDGPTTAPRHAPAFQHLGSIGGYGEVGVLTTLNPGWPMKRSPHVFHAPDVCSSPRSLDRLLVRQDIPNH